MKKKVRKKMWKLAMMIIVSVSGFIINLSLKKVWKLITKKDPPKEEGEVRSWKELITWNIISGLISSVSKLFAAQTSRRAGKRLKAV
ncbi:DUF4235 domain-containing protein [Chitinispirillales bacterium ANBcel5]|uniref:DUF4235 domain-containing protein n=1 Tax=Cellulosispirillum alkaliphilum TaxID=3039283 RepID=UPI002A531A9C|nr:DUF4235 domain-containing protein [Chitinispirillales bacterium ANBcel5]